MRCRIVSQIALGAFAVVIPAPLASAGDAAPGSPQSADATPISPELREALQDFLNYDPAGAASRRVSPLRKAAPSRNAEWKRTDKDDGSGSVTVKKVLPLSVDANVGADIGLAATPAKTYQPEKLQQSAKDTGSGAAWANVQVVPGLASLDARVDPTREQGRIGTTLGRSVPFGPNYSITLQSTYALTDGLGAQTPSAAPGPAAALPPAQFWTNDRLVKFNILSTGTSLAAGKTTSSFDNVTHNKFSAEQKLFQNFNVTTSLTEASGQPANKSITAGFKLKW
jgi:hypothetical protein